MKNILSLLFMPLLANCLKSSYDFIVVGSGAGGSTVAGRLAENGKYSVLLIESGGHPRDGYDVPAYAPRFLSDTGVTFQYNSIPQKFAALLHNGIVGVASGRMLGGTSALNYMWWNRGNPRDWNQWANITGDPSWKYDNMLKYMKRSESYHGDYPSDQHSAQGPITVSRPKYAPGLEDHWLVAARELGYPVSDPNGPQVVGFSAVEYSKKHGRRVSSYVGHVEPLLHKPGIKLDVLMNTNVTQILFADKVAIAVKTHSLTTDPTVPTESIFAAKKEIIVSAGTYNSPLLLQRSGIGPADVLRAANIKVVKDLPVGQNLQDHAVINLNFAMNDSRVVTDETRDLTPENWQYYLKYGDGPFAQTRGATGQALLVSSVAVDEGESDWPDYQLCMAHGVQPWVPVMSIDTGSLDLSPGEVPMSTYLFLGRPKSRGSIYINPRDVYGNPILDLGYLTDSRDLQSVLDGIGNILTINEETNAYKNLGTRYLAPPINNCENLPFRSESYWKCLVTHIMQGGCHAAGTNKMGRRDDPTAVVDTGLRVNGIRGLRIVDNSIQPFITNANPQAVVYAIAEKAAEMILNSWTNTTEFFHQS